MVEIEEWRGMERRVISESGGLWEDRREEQHRKVDYPPEAHLNLSYDCCDVCFFAVQFHVADY